MTTNPSKSVLIIVLGTINDNLYGQSYWSSLSDSSSHIKVTYCPFENFKKNNESYDSIIIWGHGNFYEDGLQKSGKQHRKKHCTAITKDELIKTVDLVKDCSQFSKKIVIKSCNSGAVMKDLENNPVDADVVVLGGSKYPTISYTSDTIQVIKKFILDGTTDLNEFASMHYLDTIQIQNKDKSITKLSAVKLNGQSISRFLYTPKFQTLNNPLEAQEDSWWTPVQEMPINDISLIDKNMLLGIAVNKNKINDVLFWLSAGASPNVDLTAGFQITPLRIAAQRGYLEIVKTLLAHGANPNMGDPESSIPIHAAAQEGHLEIVKALLANMDDPNVVNIHKFTPLYVAAMNGHLEIVKFLLANKANPNLADAYRHTPSAIAAQKGHRAIVAVLQEHSSGLSKFERKVYQIKEIADELLKKKDIILKYAGEICLTLENKLNQLKEEYQDGEILISEFTAECDQSIRESIEGLLRIKKDSNQFFSQQKIPLLKKIISYLINFFSNLFHLKGSTQNALKAVKDIQKILENMDEQPQDELNQNTIML